MKHVSVKLLTLVLACALFSAAEGSGMDVRSRLEAGEIVALDTSSQGSGGSARMQMLVQAPARAIWDVIISCELAFTFVDGLEHCEVLEDTGDRALVHQVVKRGWPVPKQDYVFESLREPYRRIGFRLVEGNLKTMEGYWRFEESAEGTLVDHEVVIEPGLPVPRFLVRRNIEKDMPDLLACVRGLAAGLIGPDRAGDDLARCPGALPQ
ncbi:MAG: hypothetical protein HKP03_07115 [Xanthomonadales bacterium]|nr:hypothetical protein [Xanthomonadales bacterium]